MTDSRVKQSVVDYYQPFASQNQSNYRTQMVLGKKFKVDKRYEIIDTGTFSISRPGRLWGRGRRP